MCQPLDRDPMRPWCLDVDAAPLRPPASGIRIRPRARGVGRYDSSPEAAFMDPGERACFSVRHSGITFSCTFRNFEGNPLNILVDSSHLCRSEIKRVLQQHVSLSLLPFWPRSSGKKKNKRESYTHHAFVWTSRVYQY